MVTKKQNRQTQKRSCRRQRKSSIAFRDTMRDVKRGWGRGIAR